MRTAGFCGNPSFHLYWPNKNQDRTHNILATRELIVQPGYILQFKVQYCKSREPAVLKMEASVLYGSSVLLMQIVVGCEADSCKDHHSVLLQYRKDAR